MSYPQLWTTEQFAAACGISWRALLDLRRDQPHLVPNPIGKQGNGLLWQRDIAQTAVAAIKEWTGTADRRRISTRQAALEAQAQALKAAQEKFAREQEEYRQRTGFFAQLRESREREAAGAPPRNGFSGSV